MITALTAFLAISTKGDPIGSQFMELPCQFLPNSVGHVFTTIVQTEDGRSHLFLVDTGSAESWISPHAVSAFNEQSSETKLALRLQSPTSSDSETVTFRASVDTYGVDSALKQTLRGISVEGTLGLNAFQHAQVLLDYAQDRVWLRIGHPTKLTRQGVAGLMGTSVGVFSVDQPLRADSILAVPLTETRSGSYTVKANIGGKIAQLTVDTGSEILALHKRKYSVSAIQAIGKSGGLTSKGDYQAICGVSPTTTIGKWSLPWPNIYQDEDDEDDGGVISPAEFGSDTVLLDLRAHVLYVKAGTDNDWGEAALFQFTGLKCRIIDGQVWMAGDGGEAAFASFKNEQILSIRGIPSQQVLMDLKDQLKGNRSARNRLFKLLISQWPTAEITVLDHDKPQGIRFPRHA
jgi:hypothetical protein